MKIVLVIAAVVLSVAFSIIVGYKIRKWEDGIDRNYWKKPYKEEEG